MLEIIPIGGFKEVGRNCVAVKADDEIIILDMGLHMDNYISYTQEEREFAHLNAKKLIEVDAVPDVTMLGELKKQVKAICVTHAHLDHVGAIPFLSNKFSADIHCTDFTAALIRTICGDEKISLRNRIESHDINSRFRISDNIEVEFVHVTHSTPQTVIIAVHTKYGTVLYANDYKLDQTPTMGPQTNMERLKEMDVKCLIMDSLYAHEPIKTPSEEVAKHMLKDALLRTDCDGKAVIVTTFSSHIARLKSIIEIGKKMNRKIVFLGRSLGKYVDCAERVGLCNFSKEVEMVRYGGKVKRWLSKCKKPEKYLLVVTGHQGEPNSTLSKMVDGHLFNFKYEDIVVFSCKIIPVEPNIENRERMEEKLKAKHVRIFRDVHSSGHAAREDHRELIHAVEPEHIIPAHADIENLSSLKELAMDIGYEEDKVHIVGNGEILKLG